MTRQRQKAAARIRERTDASHASLSTVLVRSNYERISAMRAECELIVTDGILEPEAVQELRTTLHHWELAYRVALRELERAAIREIESES